MAPLLKHFGGRLRQPQLQNRLCKGGVIQCGAKGAQGGLGSVGVYYKVVGKIADVFGQVLPALTTWSEQERMLCARYAAVLVERRLEANLAQAASMRSC